MKNDLKVQRDAMIAEKMKKYPEFTNVRKHILSMCGVLVIARLLFVILEIIFILNKGLNLSTSVMNFILLGLAFLFALGIYGGNKGLVYLIIIGGFYSLLNLWRQNYGIEITDSFYKIYIIIFVIVMLIQILSMVAILIKKDAKNYFKEMMDINKKLIKEQKQNK